MAKSDAFRNLRGGTIYAAAGVKPNTARAWVDINGLQLGYREGDGAHPRYDLGDAARLTLMQFLTARLQIRAAGAAHIVNSVRTEITFAAEAALLEMDGAGKSNFEHWIVAFMKADGLEAPHVRTREEHARWIGDAAIVLETVVDLKALISLTVTQFRNAPALEGLAMITPKVMA